MKVMWKYLYTEIHVRPKEKKIAIRFPDSKLLSVQDVYKTVYNDAIMMY